MSRFPMLRDGLCWTAVAALTVCFSLPALASEIYSWRTDDGGYAYTDDAKSIPPRYRDRAQTQQTQGIGSYGRLTAPPAGTMDAYAKRLSNRLEHLRALNRDLDRAGARPEYENAVNSIQVNAGSVNVGVPVGNSDEPIVIEKIRFRHHGEMATRHNLIVKQGDRVLTVIKGSPLITEINPNPGISEMVEN
ncbi:MAG: hypothetical protein JRG90_20350 [Deltaproteobacteria bacterium]|nr:hypothetical protein [Deltaproteobacteria bacterium]MBW2664838.1 hypothetical protein [Deltaproteobacteria bacterium]